jgi:hypothetical protein
VRDDGSAFRRGDAKVRAEGAHLVFLFTRSGQPLPPMLRTAWPISYLTKRCKGRAEGAYLLLLLTRNERPLSPFAPLRRRPLLPPLTYSHEV